MAEVNKRQAFVIEGAEVLPNDRGTAPGQWVEESGAVVMLLPGPPHELKAMFERQCLPRLARIVPKQVIRTLFLRVAGMAESDLDQLIAPVYKKYENPVTTILAAARRYPGPPARPLRHRRGGGGAAGGSRRADRTAAGRPHLLAQRRPAGSRGGRAAAKNARDGLRWRRARPAACWASASRRCPAARIISRRFHHLHGRNEDVAAGRAAGDAAEHGAVSQETAEAMAIGARRRTGRPTRSRSRASPGRTEGPRKRPVGTMYVGLADAARHARRASPVLGRPAADSDVRLQMALDLLRRRITGRL